MTHQVFAKLTPHQKTEIIQLLQEQDNTVGFLGDGIAIPFTSFGSYIGLIPLPLSYFPWLVATLLCYCILTQFIKMWYIRRFGKWL